MALHRTTRYQDSSTTPAPLRRVPRRGDRIGRFTVLEVLGRGGMGLVLSAYDPSLDRRVAVKLVRGKAEAADQDDTRSRLMVEARAMARLRHPNVLTIYEVGEEAGRVYLAMEQVDGGSLRVRQNQLRRAGAAPWRAILDLYIAAGRGLAAAHDAGVVHRDFKPDNVLLDRDGRVLVADFGLACATERGPRLARGSVPAGAAPVSESVGLGTPGYVSCEQYLGRAVDARADQFAFCVGLWEALYGELPFDSSDVRAYARAVVAGEVRAPKDDRDTPIWLRRILERGLRPDPAERYPSMHALLGELDGDDPPAVRSSRTSAMIALCALFTGLGAYPIALDREQGVGEVAASIAMALAGFLVVAALFRGRRRFTAVNRRLFGMLLTPLAMSLLATGAAARLGLDARATCMVLLLLWSAMAATVAASLGVRLWVAAGGYAAAFVTASLVPSTLHLVSAAAHFTLMLNAIAIWGSMRPAQRHEP